MPKDARLLADIRLADPRNFRTVAERKDFKNSRLGEAILKTRIGSLRKERQHASQREAVLCAVKVQRGTGGTSSAAAERQPPPPSPNSSTTSYKIRFARKSDSDNPDTTPVDSLDLWHTTGTPVWDINVQTDHTFTVSAGYLQTSWFTTAASLTYLRTPRSSQPTS